MLEQVLQRKGLSKLEIIFRPQQGRKS